ncbi:hypothetical protein IU433_27030 [Nocardia puris]|uniref:hypothetical protein n=1 Tax=Nocardia puris TaxID=208602 RepID=UPI0018953561|nr:hypothetical protein [Nocardia puris]MBF6213047.1 hypothetical protein [Nocardia puris]MBF6368038.1 hypothetical protein [Nocardia puris]MBF6462671.1 hypothetical protein [Nocardia puris]
MSVLTALARLHAVRDGRAQRIAEVRHVHLSDHPLVLVPLKLAGEAAAPLAVMVGTDPAEPTLLTVPQPRDRVLRLRFLAELADVVLPHLAAYAENTEELISKSGETYERCLDAPQLWVPNAGGVGFLKLLGRSVRFHRTEGENAVPESIPLLGRWLTWLCDRAEHPGSSALLPMTSVLASHWATGQSSLEDANLAALLGWIAPPPGSTGPEAAARAEDPLSVPPAGPATDPGFDNEELAPLIAAYDEADDVTKAVAARRIERALRAQVEPTWQLLWQGLALLRELEPGARVARRWNEDVGSFSYFAQSIPEGVPQARRDSAVSAVRKLLDRERALEKYEAERAFDDPRVMLEHRLAGTAFVGTVVGVDPERVVRSEKNRAVLRPILQVRTGDPVVAAEDDEFCNVSNPSQSGRVLTVEGSAPDVVSMELSGGMGTGKVARAGSIPELGDTVCFAGFKIGGGGPPAKLPAREETPWTHGGPPPEWTPESEPQEEL